MYSNPNRQKGFINKFAIIKDNFRKSEFMGGKHSEDIASHLLSLDAFMDYYNYNRYPCRLYGKTPMEIIQGQDVDTSLFSEILKQAKVDRLEKIETSINVL